MFYLMVVFWGFFFGYDINFKNFKRNEGWSYCKRYKVKFILIIYILKEELLILFFFGWIFKVEIINYVRVELNIKYIMDVLN